MIERFSTRTAFACVRPPLAVSAVNRARMPASVSPPPAVAAPSWHSAHEMTGAGGVDQKVCPAVAFCARTGVEPASPTPAAAKSLRFHCVDAGLLEAEDEPVIFIVRL